MQQRQSPTPDVAGRVQVRIVCMAARLSEKAGPPHEGFRRIFSPFEKLDALFLGFVHFALIHDAVR